MKRKEILAIVGLVTLSFAVTLAVLWVEGSRGVSLALRDRGAPPRAWWPAIPPGRGPAAIAAASAGPQHSRPPLPAEPTAEVPSSDDSGPPLPVLLAVSSHPGRVADDADDGADSAARLEAARQVDLFNTSDEALAVTVLALDVPTQVTTRAQLIISPHSQAHVGSESGLKLDPGTEVALRSSGYRELTTTVH